MVMVKLKMKTIYKAFLSFVGVMIFLAVGLGVLYLFTDRVLIEDSDVEVNGMLSINFIDGKRFNTTDKQALKFSVTNSSNEKVYYNINFVKVRGTGSFTLINNDEKVLEGDLSTADEINSDYIYLDALETKDFILEITNAGDVIKGEVSIRAQGSKTATFKDVILSNVTPTENTLTKVGTEVATLDEGLIKSSDDTGTSYYFRGSVQNNYVEFGNLLWRIVRINGDGTVRLVLDGTADTVSSYYVAGSNDFNFDNSSINAFLENWLQDNLADKTNYIANTKFCNDIGHDGGYNYNAYIRVMTNKIPTLNCLGDSFSNSIGLLTIDEVILAGASPNSFNQSFYLHNNLITDSWYTMTAASGSETNINMFMVDSSGSIKTDLTGNLYRNIRPVINLIKNVQMNGSGTKEDPYKLAEEID